MNEPYDFPDEMLLSRMAMSEIPEMELDAYRLLLRDILPPTDSQIEAFADYVACAHSWYKHLPLIPPGGVFHFFIDPHAGMDHLVNRSGEVHLRTRTRDTEPFHYSWMTTGEFRERFGYLAFSCAKGNAVFSDALVDSEQFGTETVLVDNNCLHPVLQISCLTAESPPKEVLDAGSCSLTALIHPRATEEFLLRQLALAKQQSFRHLDLEGEEWPQADTTDKQIDKVSTDPAFVDVIQHEKARLRRCMIKSMQRMRFVVFPDSAPQPAGASDVKEQPDDDVIAIHRSRIFHADEPFEKKMKRLEGLEPVIEQAYALGLTRVKPVWLITADDLVS